MIEKISAKSEVPRHEDLCRYVGAAHFDKSTGAIGASAFDRHPKDYDGLSVNRRGVFSDDVEVDNAAIRAVTSTRMTLGKTARFIVINTGAMLDTLKVFEREIFVCQDPLEKEGNAAANPAHALIVGIPFVGEEIGSMNSEMIGDQLKRIATIGFPAHLATVTKSADEASNPIS